MSPFEGIVEITSSANAHFKVWKSCLTAKGIRNEGLFLLSGVKLIREFARETASGKGLKFELVAELISAKGEAITKAPRCYRLSSELFRELDELGTHHSILVLKAPTLPTWHPSGSGADSALEFASSSTSAAEVKSAAKAQTFPASGLEIFCPLGDPQNLGAVLRVAEAFRATRVILTEEAANPFLPKTIKASAGSSLRVRIEKGPRLADLKGSFVCLDLKGTSLHNYKWKPATRLLIGEEGPGLRALGDSVQLEAISIPTVGVESLNAGVAAGIALFHYRQQNPL